MISFDFEDDPFWWIQEEMDQLQVQYSKLEFITKGASKLLGDSKPGNITKELKKLKQKDMVLLEATNMILRSYVAELKMELEMENERSANWRSRRQKP